MVAEAERVDGEEDRQPAEGRPLGPPQEEQSVSATRAMCSAYTSAMIAWLQNVYEVGKEQRGRRPGRHRSAELGGDRDDQGARERRLHRRREIQRVRGIAAASPSERDCRSRSRADSRRAA